MAQMKKAFRPEFLNRVDGIVVFRALTRDEIKSIVDLELNKVQERIAHQEIKIQATEAAKQYLSDRGYNFEFGARPLRRVIQKRSGRRAVRRLPVRQVREGRHGRYRSGGRQSGLQLRSCRRGWKNRRNWKSRRAKR